MVGVLLCLAFSLPSTPVAETQPLVVSQPINLELSADDFDEASTTPWGYATRNCHCWDTTVTPNAAASFPCVADGKSIYRPPLAEADCPYTGARQTARPANGPLLYDSALDASSTVSQTLLDNAARFFTQMGRPGSTNNGASTGYWTKQQYSHSVRVDLTRKEITIDCSCFMNSLLQSFLPNHHNEIIDYVSKDVTGKALSTYNLKAKDYYSYCSNLAKTTSTKWKSIPITKADLDKAKTANALNGAVLMWSTPPGSGSTSGDTGHVMTTVSRDNGKSAIDFPDSLTARIYVADSSNIQHVSDTRCLLSSGCPSNPNLSYATNPEGQTYTSNCAYMPHNGPGRGYVSLGFYENGTVATWKLAVTPKSAWDMPVCLMVPL